MRWGEIIGKLPFRKRRAANYMRKLGKLTGDDWTFAEQTAQWLDNTPMRVTLYDFTRSANQSYKDGRVEVIRYFNKYIADSNITLHIENGILRRIDVNLSTNQTTLPVVTDVSAIDHWSYALRLVGAEYALEAEVEREQATPEYKRAYAAAPDMSHNPFGG